MPSTTLKAFLHKHADARHSDLLIALQVTQKQLDELDPDSRVVLNNAGTFVKILPPKSKTPRRLETEEVQSDAPVPESTKEEACQPNSSTSPTENSESKSDTTSDSPETPARGGPTKSLTWRG